MDKLTPRNSHFRPGRSSLPRVLTLVAASVLVPDMLGIRNSELAQAKPEASTKAQVHFEADVLPLFKANCVQCHGPNVKTKDLNLGSYEGVMKGSESGPVIVPGKVGESRLYKMISQG